MHPGLREQALSSNLPSYNNLTMDKLEELLNTLSATSKEDERSFNAYTGKQGAIQAELSLIKEAAKYSIDTKEDLEETLERRKLELEEELAEGLYLISSDIKKGYITYIGDTL